MTGNQGDKVDQTAKVVQQDAAQPWRFGLPTLFYVSAVIAAAIALLGGFGIGWALLVLGFWLLRRFHAKITIVETLVVIGIGLILIGMLLPPLGGHRGHSIRLNRREQTKQICLAVLDYESANGHFPPAYIADKDGNPMHSWRVLILPFLEEQALFKRYDFDEPWNGPNNSILVDQLEHDVFAANPYTPKSEKTGTTGFKLVTGEETAFVEDQTKGFVDITAGSSNVIMLVDDNAKPVNWMSPEDLPLEEATELFDHKHANSTWIFESIFRIRRYYFLSIGMFDGSVKTAGFLDDTSDIREHFTIATPPATPLYDVDFAYYEDESKPGGYVLVAINFCLAIVPAFWRGRKSAPENLRPTHARDAQLRPSQHNGEHF